MLKGKTFNILYPKLLKKFINAGEFIRSNKTLEISPFIFQILDPSRCLILYKNLNFNYPSLIMKRLQILNGTADIGALCFYDSSIKNKIDPLTGLYDRAFSFNFK